MLVLAFDTATDVATSALVQDGEAVGERASRAVRILEDVDSLLAEAALEREALEGIVVGTGPGSYTGRSGRRCLDARRTGRGRSRSSSGNRRPAERGLCAGGGLSRRHAG